MQNILSRVTLKMAVIVAVLLTSTLFLFPRQINSIKAENCPNPPSVAQLNPYPVNFNSTTGCDDLPAISIRPSSNLNYAYSQNAQNGDEFVVRLYVHNGAATNAPIEGRVAHNVRVNTAISGNEISMSANGDNTNTIGGKVSLNLPAGAHIEVVGTGDIYDVHAAHLGSGINIANNTYTIGDIEACFDFARIILFKVKVVAPVAPAPSAPSGQISGSADGRVAGQCLFNGSVNWSTQNASDVEVTVRDPQTGEEKSFARQASGNDTSINWFQPNQNYRFTVWLIVNGQRTSFYGPNNNLETWVQVGNLDCSTPVTPPPVTPNAPSGQISGRVDGRVNGQCIYNGTVSWSTQNAGDVEITVRNPDNGSETAFAHVPSGTDSSINWFAPNKGYRFTVWRIVNGQRTSFYGPGNNLEAWVSVPNLDCGTTPPPVTVQPVVCNPSPQNALVNQSVSFNVTGGIGSAMWYKDNVLFAQALDSVSTSFATAGTHFVTVAKGTSASGICTVYVTQPTTPVTPVTPHATITVSTPQVCTGTVGVATLNITSNVAFETHINSPTGDLFGSVAAGTYSSQTGPWAAEGTVYYVIDTQTRQTLASAVGHITTAGCAQPEAQLQCIPANQNVDMNQTVYASATGGNGTYSWSASGATPASGSGSAFTTSYNTSGSKTITVTSGSQTANCGVQVKAVVIPTLQCSPITQNTGTNQTVYLSANGGTGSYTWSAADGSPSTGAYQTFATSFATAGTKHVTVTSGNQTSTCNIFVTAPVVPDVQCAPANQSANVNQVVYFSATGGNGSYTWATSGASQNSGTSNSFNTSFTDGGAKVVTVSSNGKSANCNVQVYAAPPAQVICSPTTQTVDVNQNVYLSAFGGNGTFSWTASGANASVNGSSLTATYNTSGTKTITVTSGGQTASCAVIVREVVIPTLQCTPANQTADPNQPVSFTAIGGNGTYSWTAPAASVTSASGNTFTTTYSASGAKVVTLKSGNQTANCNVSINAVTPQPKDYTLTTDNNFCVGQNTRYTIVGTANLVGKTIYWSSTLNGQPTGENNAYIGQTIANQNGFAFWTDVGSTWTTANIGNWTKTSNVDGISRTVNFTVRDCSPAPQQVICTPNNQTVAINQTVYASAIGGTGTYNWSAAGASPASGSGTNFNPVYNTSGSKTITVTSGNQTATCNVLVTSPTVPTLQCTPGNQSAAINQTVSFSVTGGTGSYNWSAPDATQTFGNSSNFSTSYQTSGSRNVTVTSGNQTALCAVQIQTPVQNNGYLTITKLVAHVNQNDFSNPLTADNGARVTYKITVSAQTAAVSNVQLSDTLPANATYIAGTLKLDGGIQSDSSMNNMSLGTVSVGSTRVITFDAYVYAQSGTAQTTIINTATATGSNTGSVSATATVYINQPQVAGGNVSLVFSKRASNDTKNADATSVNAAKQDYITYFLTVTNTGNTAATNFVITDDMSQVLPYADVIDNGGATLNGNIITFPGTTVPAGGSVTKSIRIRVKSSLADNLAYTMTNTYGNTVVIHINTPQVQGAFIAPKTGADTMAFTFAGFLTAAFAVFRKRKSLMQLILNN